VPLHREDLFDASVDAMAAETTRVVEALRIGGIREEEDFTSQMLSAIRAGLARTTVDGFEWDSAVLQKRTEEPVLGADFAGVLRLRLDGYKADKGFLAQAKLAGPRKRIDRRRLKRQAEDMLAISSAAFVRLPLPSDGSLVCACRGRRGKRL